MDISKENNIGALVAEDYRTASVFKKNGIDFCCNGNRSIDDACAAKRIDPEQVVHQLIEATQSGSTEGEDFKTWPLDLLADYIEKKHHRYVEARTEEIRPFLDKVCRVHGERHPELLEINRHFTDSTRELASHMKKEELILFPAVRQMVNAQREKAPAPRLAFGSVGNPIQMMMEEHSNEGDRFRIIEALTNNYTPPQDACNTYRVTFAMLKEFEADLHRHIHLENNILFPKALQTEASLVN